MKLNQLRKLIREEVRAAIQDELSDILKEAVEIASRPTKVEKLDHRWSTPAKKEVVIPEFKTGNSTLDSILGETAREVAGPAKSEIKKSFMDQMPKPSMANSVGNQMVRESSGPMPGIDISQLSFVQNAKAIFDAAGDKDKQRAGL